MNKITLEISEFETIIKCLKNFPEAHYIEISTEFVSGIGKITELCIPIVVNRFEGKFNITITDHKDW